MGSPAAVLPNISLPFSLPLNLSSIYQGKRRDLVIFRVFRIVDSSEWPNKICMCCYKYESIKNIKKIMSINAVGVHDFWETPSWKKKSVNSVTMSCKIEPGLICLHCTGAGNTSIILRLLWAAQPLPPSQHLLLQPSPRELALQPLEAALKVILAFKMLLKLQEMRWWCWYWKRPNRLVDRWSNPWASSRTYSDDRWSWIRLSPGKEKH